jgi:hypothetical protein
MMNEVDQENALPPGLYASLTARRIQQVHPAMEEEGDVGSPADGLVESHVEVDCEVEEGILNDNEAAAHPSRVHSPVAAPVQCSTPS